MTITARPTTEPEAARATGDRFVATALLTLTAILVIYQAIARMVIPPLMVFAALFALAAALVWHRGSRWRLLVAGAVALLYLAGSIPFFVANLAHPASVASFLGEAFLLIGLLTVIAGVVAGLRGAGPGDRRPLAVGALGLAGIAVVISVAAALSVGSDPLQPGDVAIAVDRSVFPEEVAVPADATALWVDNQDPFHHTLVIDGTDVHAVLAGSTAVRIPIDLAPGRYRYWCDVPGHESMEGHLDVR